MEVMIVVIIFSVMSTFALQSYTKLLKKSNCRAAQMALIKAYNKDVISTTQGIIIDYQTSGSWCPAGQSWGSGQHSVIPQHPTFQLHCANGSSIGSRFYCKVTLVNLLTAVPIPLSDTNPICQNQDGTPDDECPGIIDP